ncbi:Uncharacterized protein LHYA1_G006821 [Lachnellula hyalina]|uniref:LDB19 N-terminal domain-containing protein n=1 Tax=Lachnellula hyalina TaxID=1316788 RepID=A0A8H8QZ31_9HELO|nr:Uncharacterized protein LHYA1_G006821 [Lachnellula hyalina]TVY24800.1 Uncharacterized protein LHYA1_G006821 [Lachnellula hyalina]
MTHSISTFFRSHSSPPFNNSHKAPAEFKRRPLNTIRRPASPDRSPSSSGSSLLSQDLSVKMPDLHNKRLSLTNLITPKSSTKSIPQHHPVTLDIKIESPPAVCYGPPANSSGALISGQLQLNIQEDQMSIETLRLRFNVEVTRKKPFRNHTHCPDCTKQTEQLDEWNILTAPSILPRGIHNFPFSFLLPGHLPASIQGTTTKIEYILRAAVTTTKTGEPIKSSKVIDLKRAILTPEIPKKSIRIFPPTNITVNCEFPAVIHPIGQHNISLRVDGVVKRNVDEKTQNQWKLKRLLWRLEENEKSISPACPKHSAKLGNVDDAKKGELHKENKIIGNSELKNGWKGDYSSPDGRIEVEFPINVRPESHPTCDVTSEDGTEITHVLIIEMIISDEMALIKNPSKVTPSGAARVLRMHFNVILSERSGMGLSWDLEQPPLYQDVPTSPPGYRNADLSDYTGPPLPDYEGLPPLDDPVDDASASNGGWRT